MTWRAQACILLLLTFGVRGDSNQLMEAEMTLMDATLRAASESGFGDLMLPLKRALLEGDSIAQSAARTSGLSASEAQDVLVSVAKGLGRSDMTTLFQTAEAVARHADSDLNQIQACFLANSTRVGCDLTNNLMTFVRKQQSSASMQLAGLGSRPVAKFMSSSKPPMRSGDGLDGMAKREFFWIAFTVYWVVRLGGPSKTADSQIMQIDRRWATIFAITPTYDEWKTALSCHSDVDLLLTELCWDSNTKYKDEYLLNKRSSEGWKDDMIEVPYVWANPILAERHEMLLKSVLKDLNVHEKDLKKCWATAQQRVRKMEAKDPLPGLSRLALTFFTAMMLITSNSLDTSILSSSLGCDMNYLFKLISQEGPSVQVGELSCTSSNNIGSACVRTCYKNNGQLQQPNLAAGLSEYTGQVVVCGSDGAWLGRFASCGPVTDITYR